MISWNGIVKNLLEKWIDLRQTMTKMILLDLDQRKCVIFVTFVCLSLSLPFVDSEMERRRKYIPYTSEWWSNFEIKGQGYNEQKSCIFVCCL